MGGESKELTGPDLENGVVFGDLAQDKPLLGHAGGEAVVLVRSGEAAYAIGASCTHYGGPLAEGLVEDGTIRCPWHHARFSLRTGQAVGGPALTHLGCWKVVREGDLVRVRAKAPETESRTARALPATPSSVVIVGAGAAAAACASELRREGYRGGITMFGAEAPGPVDRPNLSKDYLAGTAPEEWIPLGSPEHYASLEVDLAAEDPVVSIDTTSKKVSTRSGRSLPYGALLYATGAEPKRPPIPGADAPDVLTLRSLADSRAIIARAAGRKRAVVVGTSFIGLEVAASLVARGLEVHVVGPDTVPLVRVLGDRVGTFVRKVHEDKGTVFHLGVIPKAIRDGAVELMDGSSIAADLVVIGVGVAPRVALAEAARLKVEDGVIVDDLFRTSAADVYAAGDVARYPDRRLGKHVRIEHWVAAERQGQAAARAMLGLGTPYRDVPFFWSVHHDVTINYIGHASSWDEARVIGSLEGRDAAVAYRVAGKTLALATIGRDALSLRVEAAMERGDDAEVERLLA
jgi:apoptosis-inducing factor 3